MASISLPRVLQQRKTSLEIERENFEKFQNQSINKAINGVEIPVKEKHVRSTIIGTFKEKGAVTFWVCATRLPLQGNRIVCWKFCHVLHKILREGHHNCLQQSQRHEQMLVDLGKLWVHLKEGYGKLIQLYCTLLISKINFHKRNPRFPGNLQVSGEELDSIGENDINNYFQMSVEIMDYMDDVLSLQSAIFDSLDNSRSNSMTSPGQCRLAPLIPCIQDSNQLYDFTVKLLFKLHAMLPADTLSGHRERFLKQFKQLKKFYQSTQNLQYFMNLISTPSLPENPPNFLIQSELRTYVPPIVILPPEENFQEDQDAIGNLIDTSENASQFAGSEASVDFVDYAGSQTSQHADIILERDKLIEHLQSEISRLRNELQSVIAENRATVASLNEQVTSLESQLAGVTADLQYEKEQRNLLVQQQMAQPSGAEVEQRVAAAEERAASFEDKFQKLKSAYKLLREEHIPLIREKAEAHRQMLALTKTTTEQEAKVETLQKTVDLLNAEKSKITETHVQSSSEAKAEAEKVKNEINILTEKYEAEKAELNATLAELRSSVLTFQSERDECQNQIKETEGKSQDLMSKLSLQHEEVQNELKSTISELRNTLMQTESQTNLRLQESNSDLTKVTQDLEQKNKKLGEMALSIAELESEKQDLQEQLQESQEELMDLLNMTENEKSALQTSLSDLQINLSELISDREKNKNKQEENNNELVKANESLEQRNVQLNATLSETKLSLVALLADKENLEKDFQKSKQQIQDLNKLAETEKSVLNASLSELQFNLTTLASEKETLQSELQDLLQQKQTAESSLQDLDLKYKEAEKTLLKEIESTASARCSFMKCSIESASDIIKNTIHELDNPAISSLQCGLEYFRSLIPVTDDALNNMEKALLAYENDKSCMEDLSTAMVKTSHLMSTVVIEGVANSNTSKDIVFGEKMAQECRDLANAMSSCVSYIHSIAPTAEHLHKENGVSNGGDRQKAGDHMAQMKRLMQTLGELAGLVGGQDDSNSGDSVEGELANMDKAIEEAAARMEEMLKKSRAADSGLKLEVNEKILDACTSLMAAVRELVKKSRVLQGEIVVLGRGTNTAKEFYKRNHQWTEGLISAAKAVALGAKLLLTAADKVVTSGGKLEHVMVASQEIAASTAQLVVASRVRAARGSEKLSALTVASKAVSTATGAVIATAKTCAQMVEETEDLDMSGMSWQAGRRIEMESRVKVLELEQALATERLKLAAVRRNTYRLTDSELNEADANSKNGNNQ